MRSASLLALLLAALMLPVPAAASPKSDTLYLTESPIDTSNPFNANFVMHEPFDLTADRRATEPFVATVEAGFSHFAAVRPFGDAFPLTAGSYRFFFEVTATGVNTATDGHLGCAISATLDVIDGSGPGSNNIIAGLVCLDLPPLVAPGVYEAAGTFDLSQFGIQVTTSHDAHLSFSSGIVSNAGVPVVRLLGGSDAYPSHVQFDGMRESL